MTTWYDDHTNEPTLPPFHLKPVSASANVSSWDTLQPQVGGDDSDDHNDGDTGNDDGTGRDDGEYEDYTTTNAEVFQACINHSSNN
jgi:hypothetical protein